jgi:hypothetical protein
LEINALPLLMSDAATTQAIANAAVEMARAIRSGKN